MTTNLTKAEVAAEIDRFLAFQFPQIAMHGGKSAVKMVDLDAGVAEIVLGGACGGCGISPMTIEQIHARLPPEIPGITSVIVTTSDEDDPLGDEYRPEVPF